MLIKIHKSYRTVVALCDTDLIGKYFEEGMRQLRMNPFFFQGEEKSATDIMLILKKQTQEDVSYNIVGKEAIAIAKKAGVIKNEHICTIQGIPYALTF